MTATTEATALPDAGRRAPRPDGGFRVDIQGLRAVAVLLVLAYHAGMPWVPGGFVGVDVFFVISGYLITGLMLREVERTGRLDLGRFYARRIRRLLPAAAVTLAGVAVLTIAVLPVTRWRDVLGDIVAGSVYVVNWRLADRAVDYLASDQAASPVQHFWSLAVEEQFYVVWPLLILALVWWQRRSGARLRRTLAVGLVAIAVPSLLWSVLLTASEPGRAYFVTTTRLWELAIGALLAIAAGRLVGLGRGARHLLGWGGLAAIVAASVRYDASTLFPGTAALLPTLGAAAVLAAGVAAPERGAGRVLGLPVMQDIGALSYALYLWHWPVLVAATALWGRDDGTLWLPLGLLAVAASVVPAWATYRMVERPLHTAPVLATRPRRAYALGAACTALGLVAAGAVQAALPQSEARPATLAALPPGAAALGDDPVRSAAGRVVDRVPSITPDPLVAADDTTVESLRGCVSGLFDPRERCAVGDADSDFVVALVGDSHALQWAPALHEIAARNHWRLEVMTMSSCGFFEARVAVGRPLAESTECAAFNARVRDRVLGPDRPDLVVSSGSNNYAVYDGDRLVRTRDEGSREALARAYVTRWRELADAGIPQVVLRNTPWLPFRAAECIATHRDALSECAFPRDDAMALARDTEVVAASRVPNVTLIDPIDHLCPQTRCAPVIGGVMVWRDTNHMTATYAWTMAGPLERLLLATGRFPR